MILPDSVDMFGQQDHGVTKNMASAKGSRPFAQGARADPDSARCEIGRPFLGAFAVAEHAGGRHDILAIL